MKTIEEMTKEDMIHEIRDGLTISESNSLGFKFKFKLTTTLYQCDKVYLILFLRLFRMYKIGQASKESQVRDGFI